MFQRYFLPSLPLVIRAWTERRQPHDEAARRKPQQEDWKEVRPSNQSARWQSCTSHFLWNNIHFHHKWTINLTAIKLFSPKDVKEFYERFPCDVRCNWFFFVSGWRCHCTLSQGFESLLLRFMLLIWNMLAVIYGKWVGLLCCSKKHDKLRSQLGSAEVAVSWVREWVTSKSSSFSKLNLIHD